MAGPIYVTFDIKVLSKSGEYEITDNLKPLAEMKNTFVLHDDYFSYELINDLVPNTQTIAINISEHNKTLSTIDSITEEMVLAGCSRETHLIAIGGGAIQDLATLVASLYMRGISWSYVPTTLMSMLDSCIGGKSSINVKNYKNILGNIYSPQRIYITSKFINTLSKIDIASGIAEAGKICYAASEEIFNDFVTALGLVNNNVEKYGALAEISLSAKKWFIEIDEFDEKERKLLNFGHTFGHALEASSDFKVPHGIAILIGMNTALNFAEIEAVNLEYFVTETFEPIKKDLGKITVNKCKFESAIAKDKKHNSQEMFFILPTETGKLSVFGFPRSVELVEKCWQSLIKTLKDMDAAYEVL